MYAPYLPRFVRFATSLVMVLGAATLIGGRAAFAGSGEAALLTLGLVARYSLLAAPVAVLLGVPAGLKPGSMLDRLLQAPALLLAGVPAAVTGLFLMRGLNHAGPGWATELGAVLAVSPWLARALRAGLAAGGRGRVAASVAGRLLQEYGSVAVCVLALEAVAGRMPALLALRQGTGIGLPFLVGLALPALVSHLAGDLVVVYAGADSTEPALLPVRYRRVWIVLGALLGVVVLLLVLPGAAHYRCSLGLGLGAVGVGGAAGFLLGLISATIGGVAGRALTPDLESPSLLAPFFAGLLAAIGTTAAIPLLAGAMGLALAPRMAPPIRALAECEYRLRPRYILHLVGTATIAFGQVLSAELLMGLMGFAATANLHPAPHFSYALAVVAAGLAGLNLLGSILITEN